NPPSPSTLALNPTTVLGGATSAATVTLNGKAPTGGASVQLGSSNTAAATVPGTVTVPAGAPPPRVTRTSLPLAPNTPPAIPATLNSVPKTATLNVNAAVLSSLPLTPASVSGGTPSTGTVTLNGAAPTGGASVSLTSGNTAVATVPDSVVVAAGATTATFTA